MYLVDVEFERVQTFLFAAPRLRDMVGANALLGQALRLTLTEESDAVKTKSVSPVPDLPGADGKDPLSAATDDKYKDNPKELFRRGILARDGGHFRVLFKNKLEAEEFCRRAKQKLSEELPGLRCSFELGPLAELAKKTKKQPPIAAERALLDLPQFQVCQATGTGPAAMEAEKKDKYDSDREAERQARRPSISLGVQKRREAYGLLRQQKSKDIVGLLDSCGKLTGKTPPNDFYDMCNGDYLAVIHADGNGIGRRSKKERGELRPDPTENDILEREAKGECFYHAMRVAVRRATVDAINGTFASISAAGAGGCRPYQLLMLGGDDLLLVCRAKSAMEFVIEYARALEKQADEAAKAPNVIAPPTIGAGIVIAPPTMPFHHLHHLAEELASSAKRLYRRLEAENRPASVVDWLVATGSWSADPIAARRETALTRYDDAGKTKTLVLARRPLPILGDATADGDLISLESLWNRTKQIDSAVKKRKIARSQLRRLVDELPKGLRSSKAAFDEWKESLGADARELLPSLWMPIGGGGDQFATSFADLVEVYEINKLSTAG
jgi:hypothetical protein